MPYDVHDQVWLWDKFAHAVQVFHPAYNDVEPIPMSRIARAFGKILTPKCVTVDD